MTFSFVFFGLLLVLVCDVRRSAGVCVHPTLNRQPVNCAECIDSIDPADDLAYCSFCFTIPTTLPVDPAKLQARCALSCGAQNGAGSCSIPVLGDFSALPTPTVATAATPATPRPTPAIVVNTPRPTPFPTPPVVVVPAPTPRPPVVAAPTPRITAPLTVPPSTAPVGTPVPTAPTGFFLVTTVDGGASSSSADGIDSEPEPTPPPSTGDDMSINVNIWIGVGVGVAVCLCLLAAVVVVVVRRRNSGPLVYVDPYAQQPQQPHPQQYNIVPAQTHGTLSTQPQSYSFDSQSKGSVATVSHARSLDTYSTDWQPVGSAAYATAQPSAYNTAAGTGNQSYVVPQKAVEFVAGQNGYDRPVQVEKRLF